MASGDPSLYRRLGVSPTATTSEIHDAYRRLAARFHPDRQGRASPPDRELAERRMREINEAWSVLGDPVRRFDYDRQRRSRGRRHGDPARPDGVVGPRSEAEDGPLEHPEREFDDAAARRLGLIRALPWIAIVGILGFIAIVTAYADHAPSPDDRPARAPEVGVGSCIDIEIGPSTTVVPCDGPHEHRIVERVPRATDCPRGSEARRLGSDGRFDCLVAGAIDSTAVTESTGETAPTR